MYCIIVSDITGMTRKAIEKQIGLEKYGEDILKILANRI